MPKVALLSQPMSQKNYSEKTSFQLCKSNSSSSKVVYNIHQDTAGRAFPFSINLQFFFHYKHSSKECGSWWRLYYKKNKYI